jgi:predicted Zn-dependent protease
LGFIAEERSMQRVRWTVTAAVAAVLLATTLAQTALASEKDILRQARVQWLQMKRHIPPEPDARVQAYVECVANRVIAALPPEERTAFDWEIVVFDEDEGNALVDPNGKIAVFNGILKVADNQDALAAIIGHEITHATQGHTLEKMRRAQRQDIWAMIGAAATGVQLREYLHLALGLPFQREQEIEADVIGLGHMSRAGFDPRAAIYFWKAQIAYKESIGREDPPEFLSTHPPDQIRIDNLIENLTPALVNYNAAREAGKRPNCSIAPR